MNLFAESAGLGAIMRYLLTAYEVLIEAGYSAESAFGETFYVGECRSMVGTRLKCGLHCFSKRAATEPPIYCWFWAGWPGMTHVRDTDQRYHADTIRQEVRRQPGRDMEQLLHAAKVAIAMPDSYVFMMEPLYGIPYFNMERAKNHGVKLRKIMHNAAVEIERCIRSGVEFDIVVNEPRCRTNGYREIVYTRRSDHLAEQHRDPVPTGRDSAGLQSPSKLTVGGWASGFIRDSFAGARSEHPGRRVD